MFSIKKLTTLLFSTSFASLATAAAAPVKVVERSLPFQATATREAMAAACTNGLPASKQHVAAAAANYPINNYTVVTPEEVGIMGWTSYGINQDWAAEHFLSGPHVMSFTHKSDPYGPFKCQYTCNANENCNAYFVSYENVGTDDEHLNCVLFDAVVPPSVFVQTNDGSLAKGAYDRLCDRVSV
ncbi:hypothetical protein N0V88_002215 [Collariella sp. IMI 366227]|nr:hypothetical protein N0V88_002215 [Collariella sp. IMI 366227]